MTSYNYQGERVHIEPKPHLDIHQQLIDFSPPIKLDLVRKGDDEEIYFRNEPIEATLSFERNRKKVEGSLKNIVAFLWEHYQLPREGIVEYGSGATGFFDAVLRPSYVPHWLQVEINPNAIAENKRRNPDAMIEGGSYKNIDKRNLSMVTGLSSWDTTGNLPQAMEQVAKALRPNGYFFHVQDVRPGPNCISSYLKNVVGYTPKYGWALPIGGMEQSAVIGFMIDEKRITIGDVFENAIGYAVKSQPSLELVINDYVSSHEVVCNDDPYMRDVDLEVYFLNTHFLDRRKPKILPQNIRHRQTTVLVTLARKIE